MFGNIHVLRNQDLGFSDRVIDFFGDVATLLLTYSSYYSTSSRPEFQEVWYQGIVKNTVSGVFEVIP